MASKNYRIHICTPEGDLDYEHEIEGWAVMPFPTLPDTMEAIGPIIANHYCRATHISVLNVRDLKFYRTIEFMVDGKLPHLAVVCVKKEVLRIMN